MSLNILVMLRVITQYTRISRNILSVLTSMMDGGTRKYYFIWLRKNTVINYNIINWVCTNQESQVNWAALSYVDSGEKRFHCAKRCKNSSPKLKNHPREEREEKRFIKLWGNRIMPIRRFLLAERLTNSASVASSCIVRCRPKTTLSS